jgi:hypothetical protein
MLLRIVLSLRQGGVGTNGYSLYFIFFSDLSFFIMAASRRILHWVFKIGNRQKSIDFYKNILGKNKDQVSLFVIIYFFQEESISLNCCMCGCVNRYCYCCFYCRSYLKKTITSTYQELIVIFEVTVPGICRLVICTPILRTLPSAMSESVFRNGLFATNLSYFL